MLPVGNLIVKNSSFGRSIQGFTLIELISVMVIIGALGSVATSRFAFLAEQADQAVIDSTYYAMKAGLRSVMLQYRMLGSPNATSNTNILLRVNNANVTFKKGYPLNAADSSHVPSHMTIDRDAAPTRLFFLFLDDSVAADIIEVTDPGPGWAMLGTNDDCSPGGNPRRCWEYRRQGSRVTRITYFPKTMEFVLD